MSKSNELWVTYTFPFFLPNTPGFVHINTTCLRIHVGYLLANAGEADDEQCYDVYFNSLLEGFLTY